jgi:hypothetical protein
MFQREAQNSITEATLRARSEQFSARSFEQLSILNTRRAHLLASATTKTAIDVALERARVAPEPAFADGAHQVEPAARPVVFVSGDDIGRTRFETQPAVNAGEQLFFLMRERVC